MTEACTTGQPEDTVFLRPDEEVKQTLRSYIKNKKTEGKKTLSIITIHFDLGLPCEQIDQVMGELEKEGLVTEND